MKVYLFVIAAVVASALTPAFAQTSQATLTSVTAANTPLALPQAFSGAAPPDLPATVSRDGDRTTVRMVRLTAPLRWLQALTRRRS